jgi:hypothetical protein
MAVASQRNQTFVDRLTEILVQNKAISREQAQTYRHDFERSDKDSFDDFLLTEGLIDEEALLIALSVCYQVPAIDVVGYFFDRELLRNFPKDFLLRNEIIPYELEDDNLVVVASRPDDPNLEADIGKFVNPDIAFAVGLGQHILDAIEEYYDKADTEVDDDADLRVEREQEEEFEKTGQLEPDEE